MPPIRDLLWGIVYPALAAGCTWAFLGGAWFKRDARWVSSLAVALAFCIAYVGLLAGPPMEPVGAREWMFWLAAGGALISPLETLLPRARFLVRVLYLGALLAMVLDRQHQNHWAGPDSASAFPALLTCVAIGLIGWQSLEHAARRSVGSSTPIVLWATAAALALCSLWSSSGLYAQLAGAVAAALGAAVVLSWIRPGTWFAGGGAGLAWALLLGIGIAAHFYAQLGLAEALLLASAPLVARLADCAPLRRDKPLSQHALQLGMVSIPLVIAAGLCYSDYAALDEDPYGSPDSYYGG